MSQVKTHATEVQKKTEPARQLEQEATRQPEQGPVQQVAPQAAYRRAQVSRNGLRSADVLALQRTVGNRQVQRMLARRIDTANSQQPRDPTEENPELTVQTRFAVGVPNDIYEQEAARLANQVMRIAEPHVQAKCACGSSPGPTGECEACRQKREAATLQRAAVSPRPINSAPPIMHEVLSAPGQPLDAAARTFMDPRFGYDFSHVPTISVQHAPTELSIGPSHDHYEPKVGHAAEQAVNALTYTAGRDVVFGAGRYAPHTTEGIRLLAHELTHIVQQTQEATSSPTPGGSMTIQRKVVLNGVEMPAKERSAFLKAHKWTNAWLAAAVIEDMAAASDTFDFSNENELKTEVAKRLATVGHMKESQETIEKIPGNKWSAFGYPFTGASVLYGPRVNYSAREYWEPAVPDNYAVRTDKAKNKKLLSKPRHERCTEYGDQCGGYGWKLSAKGRTDPYHAIAYLFASQPPHKRTLIHCDYLISLVNFMSFADSIGAAEFNKRVAAFGADKLVLKWNAFNDLHSVTFERTAAGEWAKTGAGAAIPRTGLGSTQSIRPSSEADLVIGDHVVFFNHLAYDLINATVGNAWKLENAVLVKKYKGKDIFLGHGSGYLSADLMRAKLAREFNLVAKKAKNLIDKTKSKNKEIQAAAQSDLSDKFSIKPVGKDWHIQGTLDLCTRSKKTVDVKFPDKGEIEPSEVLGLKDPCDPKKMYKVERPIESAK